MNSFQAVENETWGVFAQRPPLNMLLRLAEAPSFFDVSEQSSNRHPLPADRPVKRFTIEPLAALLGDRVFFGGAWSGDRRALQHSLPGHSGDVVSIQLSFKAANPLMACSTAPDGTAFYWRLDVEEVRKRPITQQDRQAMLAKIGDWLGSKACTQVCFFWVGCGVLGSVEYMFQASANKLVFFSMRRRFLWGY